MPDRPIRIEGDVAYIPLTKGYEAVIDATDVGLVVGVWHACEARRSDGSVRSVYAQREIVLDSGAATSFQLHRLLVAASSDSKVDHIDGDGLNNRRSNLRIATPIQNAQNRRTGIDNTSGVKGVSFDAGRGKWRAHIQSSGRTYRLGRFDRIEDAAAAYAEASARLHGEFGRVSK